MKIDKDVKKSRSSSAGSYRCELKRKIILDETKPDAKKSEHVLS
jgi:hypothetical protein